PPVQRPACGGGRRGRSDPNLARAGIQAGHCVQPDWRARGARLAGGGSAGPVFWQCGALLRVPSAQAWRGDLPHCSPGTGGGSGRLRLRGGQHQARYSRGQGCGNRLQHHLPVSGEEASCGVHGGDAAGCSDRYVPGIAGVAAAAEVNASFFSNPGKRLCEPFGFEFCKTT
ncbi:HTH-type transcriptional regulator immR, partial [Dysosmobacter welbionis]